VYVSYILEKEEEIEALIKKKGDFSGDITITTSGENSHFHFCFALKELAWFLTFVG